MRELLDTVLGASATAEEIEALPVPGSSRAVVVPAAETDMSTGPSDHGC